MKLLVIEDDNSIIDSIVLICKVGWPETEIVSTNLGEEGIDMVGSESPDVVVLDLGLPDISGLNVLKRIRLFSDVPIIILTVKEEEETIVRAFEYGVDEYLVKPFRQMELLARLKAIVRKRYSQPEEVDQKLGAFYFNFSTSSIVYNQRKINLTRNEMLILYHLARNGSAITTYSSLAKKIWDYDYPGSSDAIRVYIRQLRKKIEIAASKPKIILTKPKIGYYFVQS